jgi:hypothetical protein
LKIARTIGFRPDEEMRAAIEAAGARLGTDNISQIVRTVFMVGHAHMREPGSESAAFSRQAFREGVLAGAAAVKSQIETAIANALQEAP